MVYCTMSFRVVSPMVMDELFCKSIANFRCFHKISGLYKLFEKLIADFQSVTRFNYKLLSHSYLTTNLLLTPLYS